MKDLTVAFGGRGYKKPSSRMWAHLIHAEGPAPSLLTLNYSTAES